MPLRKQAEKQRCVGMGNSGLLNISFVSSCDGEKHHKTILVLPTLEEENQSQKQKIKAEGKDKRS